MNPEQQRLIQINVVRTLIAELGDRLGSNNPWATLEFETFTLEGIVGLGRTLRTLANVPPVRN